MRIAAPLELVSESKEALEMKLSMHAAFNFIEMADTISLRNTVERNEKGNDGGVRPPRQRSVPRRGRNRSRSPPSRRRRRGNSGGGGGGGPYQSRGAGLHRGGRRPKPPPPKPELWAAVERGDEATVRRLLMGGADAEETYQSWSPLMKAAEEGHEKIMCLLLDKAVDMEVVNRKGRTALSFAAAPSARPSGEPRPTPTGALRLLLERGADTTRKDDEGLTAKSRAWRENRHEAIEIFEEFSR